MCRLPMILSMCLVRSLFYQIHSSVVAMPCYMGELYHRTWVLYATAKQPFVFNGFTSHFYHTMKPVPYTPRRAVSEAVPSYGLSMSQGIPTGKSSLYGPWGQGPGVYLGSTVIKIHYKNNFAPNTENKDRALLCSLPMILHICIIFWYF